MASPKSSTCGATKKTSATVLRLVPKATPKTSAKGPCLDTAGALAALLKEAVAGRLSGFCYVAMIPESGFIADVVGECKTNPTFSRGMVRALDDKLAGMVIQ